MVFKIHILFLEKNSVSFSNTESPSCIKVLDEAAEGE